MSATCSQRHNCWIAQIILGGSSTELLLLGRTLPLKGARPSANNLIEAASSVVTEPTTSDYYVMDLERDFLSAEWRYLVADRDGDAGSFNRRHLEVVYLLELAEAIKTGAIHVTGSLSYDDFWNRLPVESSDPNHMAAYAAERGWPGDRAGFAKHARDRLVRAAEQLDQEVSLIRSIRLDACHRRPVLPRIARIDPPGSAIENTRERYLIMTFAYGCRLWPRAILAGGERRGLELRRPPPCRDRGSSCGISRSTESVCPV